ncbi:MAG TPA: putative 2-aminoethylphosphonate ABC transporter permease subunit [Xanthobacteraceae bacterium]|nr:putative 2-aminoethylphosphonate ABC transporter permease subunit [Xanthobacteraceae bacterium]
MADAVLASKSTPQFIAPRIDRDALLFRAGIVLLVGWLLLTIALPLWTLLSKSFQNADGQFIGFANYIRYFSTPALFNSIFNSLWVAVISTAIVIPLAYLYAFALTRSRMKFKGLFYAAALLPVFAPSLLSAISLIYLFGNQGLLKHLLFGASIYGPLGIIISQIYYCFPPAVIILVTALTLADARLYEIAEALGTSKSRVFRTVTLPGIKYGLINACFVVFTVVVTDFGIAKVIGGGFNVLATDAYKQVIGQQNFSMGAVVGMILLTPAVLAFVIDRLVQRRQFALLSARAVPLEPKPNGLRDLAVTVYATVVASVIIGLLGVAVWASFVTYWPYNLSLSLSNYSFGTFDADGWSPYFNSVKMAALAALIGTTVVFTGAYLIDKTKISPGGRALAHLLAMLPMAVPGLVLGLGYVFFFNAPWNPLNILYGTLLVLVVNTTTHFYTVAHITALTALKQIDPEFESVAASLKVPVWRTFGRVTVPICMPAILDIAVYMFVSALTTVSAVIFLYGPGTKLASVAIVHMDEAGVTAGAAAMATLIVATALSAKLLHVLLNRLVLTRLQAWRRR